MGRWLTAARRHWWRILAGLVIVGAVFVGWNAVQVWLAWRSIERVDFDLDRSRAAVDEIAQAAPPATTESGDDEQREINEPTEAQRVFDDDEVDVFLLVGADDPREEGAALGRADAVLLFIRPEGGRDPVLMSLPRDLTLVNPCTRQPSRITSALEGCGDQVTGPELLAIMVENFTTLEVDHFAVISFNAFKEVIDRLGGIEVCVDNESRFDLVTFPAGCTLADGEMALAWIRSRTPEVFIDGQWQAGDTGDVARSERQQQLLIQLLSRLKRFRSPLELADLVEDLSAAVVLDAQLSMGAAIDIAWEMRNISPGAIQRPVLPVREQTLQGKFQRVPSAPFPSLLDEVYQAS